ncbi:MAG: RNA polymerase sigma factor [Gemmataceae bacterium]|nr:RNA polymerase sigma factor [Gemmataceae bacterium]
MDARQDRDEALMWEVAGGNREALTPLIRRYATPLLTFIRRMVGDAHRSEELFQDVFLAVWTHRRQYQYPRPFKAWLYAIALNRCRAAFRRPALPSTSLGNGEAVPVAPDSSPADSAIATETAALVAGAVTLLPPQQRAVVVLRVWEQMSYADIADALNCTEATARSHMHHGLSALRKYLEPRLG